MCFCCVMLILRALHSSRQQYRGVCTRWMMNRVPQFKPHSIRSCKHEMRIVCQQKPICVYPGALIASNWINCKQIVVSVFVMRTSLAHSYIVFGGIAWLWLNFLFSMGLNRIHRRKMVCCYRWRIFSTKHKHENRTKKKRHTYTHRNGLLNARWLTR